MARSPDDRRKLLLQPGNLWSYSSLHRFEECPRQWAGRYLLGWTDPPSAPLVQGLLCHTVLADAIAAGAPPTDWSVALAAARLRTPHEALVSSANDDERADWLQRAWVMRPQASHEYAEVAWLAPVALTPDAPRPHVDLAPAEHVLASGVPYAWFRAQDLVREHQVDALYAAPDWVGLDGQQLTLVDWKTSQVGPSRSPQSVAQRYVGQLTLYALLARRHYPHHHTVDRRIHLLPAATTVTFPPADDGFLAQSAHHTADTVWRIKATAQEGLSAFLPTLGDACRFCAIALRPDGCPSGAAYRHERSWDAGDADAQAARQKAGVIWDGDKAISHNNGRSL